MMAIIKRLIIVSLLFIISCKSNKLVINKNDELQSKKYLKYYLELDRTKDTLLLQNKIYSIKINSDSFCIGKFKDNHKRNKWFYYTKEDDIIQCYMIKKHNKKTAKLIWIDALYNEPFF